MDSTDKQVNSKIESRYSPFAKKVTETNQPLPFNIDGFEPKGELHSARLAERLYNPAQLVDIPEPAINASIGCGNPLAIAFLQPGNHVLDLGSGGGIDCFQAAKAVGENGRVIGVDATPDMIALANNNKAKMGIENVAFRLGRIEDLPVDSDSIDLIISNCVIDISPDKTAVFNEAFRVLKQGGQIAITDTVLLGNLPPQLKTNIDHWAGAVITPLISLEAYLAYIIEAGFINVRVDSLTSYGLEGFDKLDEASQKTLTENYEWEPLPTNTGLYSAAIWAEKPKI